MTQAEQLCANLKLPVPTTGIQLYVLNKKVVAERKQFIATVSAIDTREKTLLPDEVSWTYSGAVESPYCYVPAMENIGTYSLKELSFEKPVKAMEVKFHPWNSNAVTLEESIKSLRYALIPSRSLTSSAEGITVIGTSALEVVSR